MPIETYRRIAILLVALALLAGCGGKAKKPVFAYDASKSLDLKTASTRKQGTLEIRDISFAGPKGRLTGYLVVPAHAEHLPAVLYIHGAAGDRSELLSQAEALAKRGAIGLTVEMNYSPHRAPPPGPPGLDAVKIEIGREVDTVREIRRSVDLLESLPSVDHDRIGYAGSSAGARYGAITSGVERRIKAYDLLAGGAAPISVYLQSAPQNLRSQLEPLLNKTDPLRYVGHAAPAALFFQDGRNDEIVPQEALAALARAGSKPKELRWYRSGHVPSNRAWADSRDWLLQELRG